MKARLPSPSRLELGAPAAVTVCVSLLAVADGRLRALLCRENGPAWRLPRRPCRGEESLDRAARLAVRHWSPGADGYAEQLLTWREACAPALCLAVGYLALSAAAPEVAPTSRGEGDAAWWAVDEPPPLPAADARCLYQARESLRRQIGCSNVAAGLLPDEFSLTELQRVHEAVRGRPLDKRNFRKWALGTGLIEPTHRLRRDGAHRPARLYRFAGPELRFLDP